MLIENKHNTRTFALLTAGPCQHVKLGLMRNTDCSTVVMSRVLIFENVLTQIIALLLLHCFDGMYAICIKIGRSKYLLHF